MARGEDTSKHPSRKVDREKMFRDMFAQIMPPPSNMGMHSKETEKPKSKTQPNTRPDKTSDLESLHGDTNPLFKGGKAFIDEFTKKKK